MTAQKRTINFDFGTFDVAIHINAEPSEWGQKLDSQRAAARAERDRAIIAKLCRQKRYRTKYQALGLWPVAAS